MSEIPRIDFVAKMREIKQEWIPALRKDNTGIGYTLETKIGIKENNYAKHDFIDSRSFAGIHFELKSQRYRKFDPRKPKPDSINNSLISLVTQAPHGGISNKELISKYGYADSQGRNRKNLYATISATRFIKSKHEFIAKMKIKRESNVLHLTVDDAKIAYVDLSKILNKLENLIIVRAGAEWKRCKCDALDMHRLGYHEYFRFAESYIYTGFMKEKFYELIDTGKIYYDLRMHEPTNQTTGEENYDTKHDHGTGFRTSFKHVKELYEKETII